MELDSPDVEDFPGLYAAETDEKAKKNKDGSDGSEGEHDKLSKKDLLIGRRKDKKDKKDRGYAALEGESSPEEELDSKSPSKSRKSKAFKFTSSKSKEKREKSRDKEKLEREARDDEAVLKLSKEKEKDKKKDKDKKKEKEKEKDKKFKEKDKKDKKSKQIGGTSEEILELGDVQPVFGVSINLATERSRCHDGIDLPLVVRDCIDYLQEQALKNEQIYKVDPVKTRLQQFKRLYNNRERQSSDELDMPTACGLLKTFLSELPEPVLTTDLMKCFEEVASHPQVTKQEEELRQLLELLPERNKILLAWVLLHFDSVLQNERSNKMNAQTLAMLLSPCMQMSHRLLVALLCHAPNLFANVELIKYIPPLTASSPKLPETPDAIKCELRKQESLLAQIHAEMNAGFVMKRREEQLWEVQRIITQLKRKLRSFEKKMEKSVEELPPQPNINFPDPNATYSSLKQQIKQLAGSDEESLHRDATTVAEVCTTAPECVDGKGTTTETAKNQGGGINLDEKNGLMLLPKGHPEYYNFIQLQLEHQELLAWKTELQARISAERAEILQLKQLLHQQSAVVPSAAQSAIENSCDLDTAKLIENYIRENALFEHLNTMLAKEIFEERKELLAIQVELAMQQLRV